MNVLATTATPHQLAEAGVARISTGSLLYRAALTAALTTARAVRDGHTYPTAISYDQANHPPTPPPTDLYTLSRTPGLRPMITMVRNL